MTAAAAIRSGANPLLDTSSLTPSNVERPSASPKD